MRIPLADLRPGAVLAAPAVGPGGRQLAPVGTTLTALTTALCTCTSTSTCTPLILPILCSPCVLLFA